MQLVELLHFQPCMYLSKPKYIPEMKRLERQQSAMLILKLGENRAEMNLLYLIMSMCFNCIRSQPCPPVPTVL